MKANTQLDDWANNIFAGMVYSSLGCRGEAEECVMCNIDFGFESEVSGRLLARMELDELPQRSGIHEDTSLNERTDSEEAVKKYQLGKSYVQKANNIDKFCTIIFIAIWLVIGYEGFSYVMTDSVLLNIFAFLVVAFFVIIGMSLSADKLKKYVEDFTSKYIKSGRDLYIEAAENGNVDAMYALGIWCIKDKAKDESIRWFRKAAVLWHLESQKALSKIYSGLHDNAEAYMWAYLMYLCAGTDEPDPENYRLSGFNLMASEASAQKIYDEIQKRKEK